VAGTTFGRAFEPAFWVLLALDAGALPVVAMFDAVRRLNGPIGHGTLLGAVARLEREAMVEVDERAPGQRAYRLTELGAVGSDAAWRLRGDPPA
jgi:hypothetical protein